MTIKSDWVKIWKAFHPAAFQPKCSLSKPAVYFIDGQIKLMKSSHVRTWDSFIHCQFVSTIQRALQRDCTYVVLAFDNYNKVPTAKNMTQMKRNRVMKDFSFASCEELPELIPECWEQAIRNRVFKSKVIDLIKRKIPQFVNLKPYQRLIIDHDSTPTLHLPNGTFRTMDDIPVKGECDVKFTSYTHLGDMVIDAIDGDYLPMAMMHIEDLVIKGDQSVPNISVYRMTSNIGKTKEKNRYEFCNINELMHSLQSEVRRFNPGCKHPILFLASLVTMTGCDYTQGIMHIGPKRIWNKRITFFHKFPETSDKRPLADVILDISHHLCNVYSTYISVNHEAFLRVNARNSHWTLLYWKAEPEYPDPISPEFGFQRNPKTGIPEYAERACGSAKHLL